MLIPPFHNGMIQYNRREFKLYRHYTDTYSDKKIQSYMKLRFHITLYLFYLANPLTTVLIFSATD